MTQAVELTNGVRDKERRRLLAILVLGMVIPGGVLLLQRHGAPAEWPWREIAAALLPPYETVYVSGLLPAAALTLAIYLATLWRGSRVLIGPDGISHDARLPRWMKFLNLDWSYRWSEVTLRPAVERIHMPGQAWLVVEAGDKRHRLHMLGWHRTDGTRYETAAEARQRALTFMSLTRTTEDLLERSALLNTLSESGIQLAAASPQQDSLARVKGGMVVACVTIGGFLLGAAGMMIPFEKFIFGTPWAAIVAVGVAATIIAAAAVVRWMRILSVAEKLVLPILVGGAAAFVSIPGLLVLNAVTAAEPMRLVSFVQQPDLTLVPVNAQDVPHLRLERYTWYWMEFDAGHVHEIRVRRGGLGFWTYDWRHLAWQMRTREEKSGR